MEIDDILQDGIGRRVTFLGRAAAMVDVSLSEKADDPYEYCIHIDTEADLFYQGEWYTGSCEMDQHMDAPYDRKVKALLEETESIVLTDIYYDETNCLHLLFDNSLEIHSRNTTDEEEEEDDFVWIIFYGWKAADCLICYPKGVVLEHTKETQELVDTQKELAEIRHRKIKIPASVQEANDILRLHAGRKVKQVEFDEELSLDLEPSAAIPHFTGIIINAQYLVSEGPSSAKQKGQKQIERNLVKAVQTKPVYLEQCYTDNDFNLHLLLSNGTEISSVLEDPLYDSWRVLTVWSITDDLIVGKERQIISRHDVSQEELDRLRIKLWEMEDALESEE